MDWDFSAWPRPRGAAAPEQGGPPDRSTEGRTPPDRQRNRQRPLPRGGSATRHLGSTTQPGISPWTGPASPGVVLLEQDGAIPPGVSRSIRPAWSDEELPRVERGLSDSTGPGRRRAPHAQRRTRDPKTRSLTSRPSDGVERGLNQAREVH